MAVPIAGDRQDRRASFPISEHMAADHTSAGTQGFNICEYLASVPSFFKPRIIYSRLTLTLNIFPLTPTSQLFFSYCFPSSSQLQ
jgi:hypothetical protein